MKKFFFPALIALIGFLAGIAVCYLHFTAPRHNEVRPPAATASPTASVNNNSAPGLFDPAELAFDWKPAPLAEPQTSAPQTPYKPDWPNFAVPMPQPSADPKGEYWRPAIIIPTIPPKYQRQPHLDPLNGQPQLILPTFPPKTLDHNFVDAR